MNKTKVIFKALAVCLFMGLIMQACSKDDFSHGKNGGNKWIDSTGNNGDSSGYNDNSGNGNGNGGGTDSSGIDSTGYTDSTGNDWDNGYGGNAPDYTGSGVDSFHMELSVWEFKPAFKKDQSGNKLFILYGKVYDWDGQFPATVKSNSNLIRTYTDQYFFWDGYSWARRNL